jgi:hypothetical protein
MIQSIGCGMVKRKIPKTCLELFNSVGIFLPCNTLIYKDISKKFQNSKFGREDMGKNRKSRGRSPCFPSA